MSLQLTPDGAPRKRTSDEMTVDSLGEAPMQVLPAAGTQPPVAGAKNPLHWKDDGKDSNCVQLAEATLRHNPYQSKWGDIAANWNRVLKDLQEKSVIPLDKDYRCLQHKMKSLLDIMRAHNEAMKTAPPNQTPRRPFSDKLFGLLSAILEYADSAERDKGSEKKSKKRASQSTSGEIASPLPGDIDAIGLAAADQAVDGSGLLMSAGMLPQKENGKGSDQRRLELEERDHRVELALQEQRAALERERAAYEKRRQEWDEARLVRDVQASEAMKATLATLTSAVDLLSK